MDPARSSILLFVFLLFCGGYFSGTEIALASINKIRITAQADDGDKRAKKVAYILDNFEKALTTLLIGTNISHIGCSAVATTFVYTLIRDRGWPASAQVFTTLTTTVLVFLFAEMIPKVFAKSCNEKYAKAIAGSFIIIMKILTPLSVGFTALTGWLSRPFIKKADELPTVTEEELHEIIDTVVQEGELDEDAGELVQSALEFSDSKVREVFTPWKDVITLNINDSTEKIQSILGDIHHSRLPVVDDDGNVVGVLQVRTYLRACLKEKSPVLADLMTEPFFTQQGKSVDDLMDEMNSNRVHMSIVKNAKGAVIGIITMEDILEELVGEIYDEEDVKGGLTDA